METEKCRTGAEPGEKDDASYICRGCRQPRLLCSLGGRVFRQFVRAERAGY